MDILDFLNDPMVKGAGGGGLSFLLWYILKFLMKYMNTRNEVEIKDTEKETLLIEQIGNVSDALVTVSNTNHDTSIAMREVAKTLTEFRVDSIAQHNKTRDALQSQGDKLAEALTLFHENQAKIVETLSAIRNDNQKHDTALSNIKDEFKVLSDTMKDTSKSDEILALLQKIHEKIESLDSKVESFTTDIRSEIETAKNEVNAIKQKVIDKEEQSNDRKRQSASDRTDNPPTARASPPTA